MKHELSPSSIREKWPLFCTSLPVQTGAPKNPGPVIHISFWLGPWASNPALVGPLDPELWFFKVWELSSHLSCYPDLTTRWRPFRLTNGNNFLTVCPKCQKRSHLSKYDKQDHFWHLGQLMQMHAQSQECSQFPTLPSVWWKKDPVRHYNGKLSQNNESVSRNNELCQLILSATYYFEILTHFEKVSYFKISHYF